MYFARSWLTCNDYCRHVCIATLELQHRVEILKDVETLQMSPKRLPKTLAATVISRLSCAPLQQSMKGLSTGFPLKDTSKVGDFSMDVSQPARTWPEWLEDCHTHIWDPKKKPRPTRWKLAPDIFASQRSQCEWLELRCPDGPHRWEKSRLLKRTKSRTSFSSET